MSVKNMRPRLRDYPEAIRTALCLHELMNRQKVDLRQVHISSDGENTSVTYCGVTFHCGRLLYGGQEFADLWAAAATHWNRNTPRVNRQKQQIWEEFKESIADMDALLLTILNAPSLVAMASYNLGDS